MILYLDPVSLVHIRGVAFLALETTERICLAPWRYVSVTNTEHFYLTRRAALRHLLNVRLDRPGPVFLGSRAENFALRDFLPLYWQSINRVGCGFSAEYLSALAPVLQRYHVLLAAEWSSLCNACPLSFGIIAGRRRRRIIAGQVASDDAPAPQGRLASLLPHPWDYPTVVAARDFARRAELGLSADDPLPPENLRYASGEPVVRDPNEADPDPSQPDLL